jgi:hypothetical protein
VLEGRKRIVVLVIVFALVGAFFLGVSAMMVSITPSSFFLSPIYWAGLAFFFALGFDIADKRRIPWYTRISFLGGILVPGIVGRFYYTDAYAFFYGLAGFFLGAGAKGFYDVGFAERRAYCPTCDRTGWIIKKHGKWYCERLGHEVIRDGQSGISRTGISTVSPSFESDSSTPATYLAQENLVQDRERYIGGFTSIQLSLGKFVAGYGIYVTDRRIFGLGQRSAGIPETSREFNATIPPVVTEEQNRLMIGELERKRELVIAKAGIESMTISKPPGVFRMGHLHIALRSGQAVDFGIGKMKAFDQLLSLMKQFYPEVTVPA